MTIFHLLNFSFALWCKLWANGWGGQIPTKRTAIRFCDWLKAKFLRFYFLMIFGHNFETNIIPVDDERIYILSMKFFQPKFHTEKAKKKPSYLCCSSKYFMFSGSVASFLSSVALITCNKNTSLSIGRQNL